MGRNTFEGSCHFRQRLICATLSGKTIRIQHIRSDDENPGLTEYEANALRLLDTISNGARIEINETGTVLKYTPGMILGGKFQHDCGNKRSIGWFLEILLALGPFAKKPMQAVLTGITNDQIDVSIDTFRSTTLPLLKHFGLEEGLELSIKKRGAPPNGGGEVHLKCPVLRSLKSFHLVEPGFVKRIRGIAYSARVSPQTSNRMVDVARGIFNNAIPDVYIYSDHATGPQSGLSPGFALQLTAETTTGMLLSAEAAAIGGTLPEDVATEACHALCEEIKKGGCVDTCNQGLVLLFMALSPEDVSKVRFGKLTPYTIECLRLIREMFGITFKIRPEPETTNVLLSCLGMGYKNLSKKVT